MKDYQKKTFGNCSDPASVPTFRGLSAESINVATSLDPADRPRDVETERAVTTFDDDYIYFSDHYLTSERTMDECSMIIKLCSLKQGDAILDLGCGRGRISNELARLGYQVTGIDWNKTALKRASSDARSLGVDVEYLEMNFLELKWKKKFDCVLSWYTSFGYFDDQSNRQMLSSMYAATKDHGVCLIDHINRDFSLKNFQRQVVHQRDNQFMIDNVNFDAIKNSLMQTRQYVRHGQIKETPYEIRLFTFTELADWMRFAGYSDVQGYGREGEPFSLDSQRMIAVATKRI